MTALQQILGPIDLVNMAATTLGFEPIEALMYTHYSTAIGLLYLWIPFMVLAIYLALFPAMGLLKYRFCYRWFLAIVCLAPLVIAHLVIGIATLMFNRNILGLPGSIGTTVIANTTYGLSFAFLVILAQLMRYDWRMDEAAMVFGARPTRCFFEITLPNIWPAILGAFLVTFILAFNNLEISFYNLGATPTLPPSPGEH